MDLPVVLLVIALATAAALGWACYRLLVDRGHLLLRLEAAASSVQPRPPPGLPPGAFLNDFALPAPDGRTVTLSDLTGRRLLIVVLQTECLFSRAFARELRDQARSPDSPLPVLLLSGAVDDPDRLAAFAALPGQVVLDTGGQMARLLRVATTPAGYLVDERRCTASPLLVGPEALLTAARGAPPEKIPAVPTATTALDTGLGRRPAHVPLAPGAEAPDFVLPRLGGGEWSLRAQRGRPLTLLFSEPACPPCQTLLAALAGVYDERLVIVSQHGGAHDELKAGSVNSAVPILLQERREVARAFGTLQTPVAFAIDPDGAITAGPGIGVAAALEVVRGTWQALESTHG
jgi:peroxiredoxin